MGIQDEFGAVGGGLAQAYTPPEWDVYFLIMAASVALKSKDPKSRVGAVICTDDHVVISTGYNGFARGVFDDPVKLEVTDEKLKWVCHAEANAIANAARLGVGLLDTHIYVNKFPCFGCCNLIIQSGIRRVYTLDNEYWKNDPGDLEGTRKKKLLTEDKLLQIVAPRHPDFAAQSAELSPSLARIA